MDLSNEQEINWFYCSFKHIEFILLLCSLKDYYIYQISYNFTQNLIVQSLLPEIIRSSLLFNNKHRIEFECPISYCYLLHLGSLYYHIIIVLSKLPDTNLSDFIIKFKVITLSLCSFKP